MLRVHTIAFFFLVSAFLGGHLVAQNQGEFVKVNIQTLANEGVIRDLLFRSKSGVESLDVYSRGFGIPLKYEGPRDIVFFRTSKLGEGFEEQIDIVGKVRVPDGATHLVLLFQQDSQQEEEAYRITPIPNDPRTFPPGAFRFFNTTTELIYCLVGGQEMRLAPNSSQIVSVKGNEEGNFELKMFRNPGAKAERIYSSVWHSRDSRRTNVFLSSAGSRIQEIEVRKIVEPIVIEEEE